MTCFYVSVDCHADDDTSLSHQLEYGVSQKFPLAMLGTSLCFLSPFLFTGTVHNTKAST